MRQRLWLLPAAVLGLFVITAAGAILRLEVPEPTGPFAVGRQSFVWTDPKRPETHTPLAQDARTVAGQIWYPAERGTGRTADYVADLSTISKELREELGSFATWGLRFVRDRALTGARVARDRESYPVVLLSPGNATNVAFYASIAEELASNGYVVVGVDHLYQSAAVALPDGSVASYDTRDDAMPPAEGIQRKIDERAADLRFVRSELGRRTLLGGRLDLGRVAVIGHSNGGLAAAEACRRDAAFRACMNIDGQQLGGPFSAVKGAPPPVQPFMFLTKEMLMRSHTARAFEQKGHGAYRVIIPSASHEGFTDGALFTPSLKPFWRNEDRVMTVAKGFTRAFLDVNLKGASQSALARVDAPTEVYVDVYPLGANPPHGRIVDRAPASAPR